MKSTDRIVRKNCRITFQKSEVTVDRYQNHINAWTDYFSCFAYADTLLASESGNEIISEKQSVTFETRFCPELAVVTSTGYRIVFNGRIYNILSVDMMNYQNESIKFRVQYDS